MPHNAHKYGYGSFDRGVGSGSGEAQSVSDTKFQKSMSVSIQKGATVSEPLGLCSKWAFLGDFGAFSLTFTDINHVSMSVESDIIRHKKCPNVRMAGLAKERCSRV